jgi:glutamyl-tRNA synthetase
MTVRVRFAPSPTGYLHIGGARTALYNYLFAKARGGKFILRVEDTDLERSKKEYEASQIADLKWLGIEFDEGPHDHGYKGDLGPYRQSERMDIYKNYGEELIKAGKAYYDFCTDEELEMMKAQAAAEGDDPFYSGKWKDEAHWPEAKARIAAGETAPIRFKVHPREITFKDHVRGVVTFPDNMVGDFVIIRSNGMPTYNYCNVIDDHLHGITHVLRGEEHLNNTVRQLMLYEAYGWKAPEYAHLSLLIGQDRQKLSKRHGATSVDLYKNESYLPEALTNYLCLLGWSHPEEKDIFTMDDLKKVFTIDRFNKAPAIYDMEKLKWVNGQHLHKMSDDEFLKKVEAYMNMDGHFFNKRHDAWKMNCAKLFKEKIQLLSELPPMLEEFLKKEHFEQTEQFKEIMSWETTPKIASYLKSELSQVNEEFVTPVQLDTWMEYCKKELGVKGKPLFMGFRACLTGQDHGPDLKILVPLIEVTVLKKRLSSL